MNEEWQKSENLKRFDDSSWANRFKVSLNFSDNSLKFSSLADRGRAMYHAVFEHNEWRMTKVWKSEKLIHSEKATKFEKNISLSFDVPS